MDNFTNNIICLTNNIKQLENNYLQYKKNCDVFISILNSLDILLSKLFYFQCLKVETLLYCEKTLILIHETLEFNNPYFNNITTNLENLFFSLKTIICSYDPKNDLDLDRKINHLIICNLKKEFTLKEAFLNDTNLRLDDILQLKSNIKNYIVRIIYIEDLDSETITALNKIYKRIFNFSIVISDFMFIFRNNTKNDVIKDFLLVIAEISHILDEIINNPTIINEESIFPEIPIIKRYNLTTPHNKYFDYVMWDLEKINYILLQIKNDCNFFMLA